MIFEARQLYHRSYENNEAVKKRLLDKVALKIGREMLKRFGYYEEPSWDDLICIEFAVDAFEKQRLKGEHKECKVYDG